MIDFIGIGAQRSGTSWVYACLYEHPEICAPIKEIHFFSRDRFLNGKEWYEAHFKKCDPGKVTGEFSTSYLYTKGTAHKIHTLYPDAKIIAILRNPISRAFSQYGNAIKGGEIPESMSFETYYKTEKSVLEQGLYMAQLKEYIELFRKEQLCICIYDDNQTDPRSYIQSLYRFLGVSDTFSPSMLFDEINISRVPRHIIFEKIMHRMSEFLRRYGLDRLVHNIRRSGLPDFVRSINTKPKKKEVPTYDRAPLIQYFKEDVTKLSTFLGRDLVTLWKMN